MLPIDSQVLGLSIDEAIAFWRKSFSNIIDDKFNKEYKYNIRHSYGLEGKRANYPAKRYVYTCRVTTTRADGCISLAVANKSLRPINLG